MLSNRLKTLRVVVIIVLVLLAAQYEFGMAVNIADPPAITPFSFSLTGISEALRGVGLAALLHAGLGGVLVILALVSLVLSLGSRVRGAQIFGALGFLTLVSAAAGGVLFVLSGFQDDHNSHQMATGFLLTFVFYFLELYVLKPGPSSSRN